MSDNETEIEPEISLEILHHRNDNDNEIILERLHVELQMIRNMRHAFTSSLQMLEAARDDLMAMGLRMDRLQQASQLCRIALLEQESDTNQKNTTTNTTTTAHHKNNNNEKSQEFVGQGK